MSLKAFWGLENWYDYLFLPIRVLVYSIVAISLGAFILFMFVIDKILGD